MATDQYKLTINDNTTDIARQLAHPLPFAVKDLARRAKVTLGDATTEQALEKVIEHVRGLDLPARRGLLMDRLAKLMKNYPAPYHELGQLVGVEPAPVTAKYLAKVEQGLASMDVETWTRLLESHSLLPRDGGIYLMGNIWLLHALLHHVDPATTNPPPTAVIRMRVESLSPDSPLPKPNEPTYVRSLAIRLLAFLEFDGPLKQEVPDTRVPALLKFPFDAQMADHQGKTATISVLLSKEAAAPYPMRHVAGSTAWAD